MVISWERLGEPIGVGLYAVEGLGFVVADPGLVNAAAQQGTGVDLDLTVSSLHPILEEIARWRGLLMTEYQRHRLAS